MGLRWSDVDLPGRALFVRRFNQLRAAAGLDWLHLHDLRHAFATILLDQGKDLRTVLELLWYVLGTEINRGKCWWSPGDSNP
ncbi:tyrosine-type recombinase/integrase [Micromonospora cremea]|uniref:tyrosine-type recombinase/integrase n=1 Tax=Micromonospora cremea TaxID=709881 RepID=UPI000940CB6A|nr:tyrosine-type recombinase/integrase [Micromonospora cremea]